MGQQEVYDFLKCNKRRWYTSKEISGKLDISLGSITTSLKKLRQCKLVDYKSAGKRNLFQYRFKK